MMCLKNIRQKKVTTAFDFNANTYNRGNLIWIYPFQGSNQQIIMK